MTDYEVLYQQKCLEFDQLNEQFLAYQEESNIMIEEIENENKQLKSKTTILEEQLDAMKQKKKSQTNNLQKELDLIKRERNDFKTKFQKFHSKVVELENINETLESENRASNCMLNEYEQRVQKTMEELALLQIQLQESKSTNQEQVARLKNQLKQTEEELYVLHLKHQKHNDESEQRRSRLSSASFSSSQDDFSRILGVADLQDKTDENLNNILNLDFKRNKEPSFNKTITLVKNLIGQIEEKTKNINTKKRISAAS